MSSDEPVPGLGAKQADRVSGHTALHRGLEPRLLSALYLVGVLLDRGVGFLNILVMATFYGASGLTDIYAIGTLPPIMVTNFFMEVCFSALLPHLRPAADGPATDQQRDRINLVLTVGLSCTLIVGGILWCAAPLWLTLAAPGYSSSRDLIAQGIILARWGAIHATLSVTGVVIDTVLVCLGQSAAGVLRRSLTGLVGLGVAVVLIHKRTSGIEALLQGPAATQAVSVVVALIILRGALGRNSMRLNFRLRDPWLREVVRGLTNIGTMPLFYFGMLGVERALASMVSQGSATVLNYARSFVSLVGLVPSSIANGSFPLLVHTRTLDFTVGTRTRQALLQTYWWCAVLGLPILTICLTLNTGISIALFGRGALTQSEIRPIYEVSWIFLAGFVNILWYPAAVRFYQAQLSFSLLRTMALLSMTGYLAVALLASRLLGTQGLAASYTLTMNVGAAVLLFRSLRDTNVSWLPSARYLALGVLSLASGLMVWLINVMILGPWSPGRGLYVRLLFLSAVIVLAYGGPFCWKPFRQFLSSRAA
jgi:peptidoglycan biosynthesis protein MviN/MurJ (putative lipid II flippase)